MRLSDYIVDDRASGEAASQERIAPAPSGYASQVGDWLRARTAASPDKTALLVDGRAWRYRELDQLVDRLCAQLQQLGVRPGDHAGLRMPNSLAFVVTVHAASRMRVVLVPINMRLTAAEVGWQLAQAECRWLLGERPLAGADTIEEILLPPHISMPADSEAFLSWLPVTAPEHEVEGGYALDRMQAIVFTSGTTGFPKGAMLTFGNHFWSAVSSSFRLGTRPDDRWLVCLPLYHVGGLAILFRCCLYGTTAVVHPGFSIADVDRALTEEGTTLVSLVPTMLQRLIEGRESIKWPALRLVLLGGSAASETLLRRVRELNIPVAATYGLTECASQVATQDPNQATNKKGSAGRPLLFTSVRIVTDSGELAASGEAGEIVVSGPTVMAGYYAEQEATAPALRGGEMHTGDIGYLDEDGDLWLLGRRSDLIVSGGENIYPAEIERVLREHAEVVEATVVGLPDADWGQQVAAMIVTRPDSTISPAQVEAFVRERLAGYKCPKQIRLVSELPLTASGKIHRERVVSLLSEPGGEAYAAP